MSDNPTIAATPYPFYATGQDDDSFRAALTSHASASVERNQDAQFSAGRDRAIAVDVLASAKDQAVVTLENRVHLEARAAISDRHRDRQFAELKAELASMRSAQLERELADVKAAARASTSDALLARLITKLGA